MVISTYRQGVQQLGDASVSIEPFPGGPKLTATGSNLRELAGAVGVLGATVLAGLGLAKLLRGPSYTSGTRRRR